MIEWSLKKGYPMRKHGSSVDKRIIPGTKRSRVRIPEGASHNDLKINSRAMRVRLKPGKPGLWGLYRTTIGTGVSQKKKKKKKKGYPIAKAEIAHSVGRLLVGREGPGFANYYQK